MSEEGLVERLSAEYSGMVTPLSPYNYKRDKETKMLNPRAIRAYSLRLAEAVKCVMQQDKLPIVLGGGL